VRLAGSVAISAPRDKVWAFLLDPDRTGSCLPGVESIERLADGRFRAQARVGSGIFSTKVEIIGEYTRLEPPAEATLVARGSGLGSSGEATARLTLRDGGAGSTIVEWTAELTLAGMAAAFEGRLADGTVDRAVAETFDCVRARLEA
jgi:carbon monoxide dehydrogenase subunit G